MVGEGLFPDGADYDPDSERAWRKSLSQIPDILRNSIDLPGTGHFV